MTKLLIWVDSKTVKLTLIMPGDKIRRFSLRLVAQKRHELRIINDFLAKNHLGWQDIEEIIILGESSESTSFRVIKSISNAASFYYGFKLKEVNSINHKTN